MPMLNNSRHEAFAHGIAAGKSVEAAYSDAGYSPNSGNASRLNGKESVVARVADLKALVQDMRRLSLHNTVLSKDWVVEQLIGVVMDARTQERPDSAGANKALHLLGLELGMYVERKEVGKPGEFDGLTIATKRERILGIATQLGLLHVGHDGQRRFGDYLTVPESIDGEAK
jgi:phage terminase small subunit